MRLVLSFLLFISFICQSSTIFCATEQSGSVIKRKKALFVKEPQKDKPICFAIFRGLGKDPLEVRKAFEEVVKDFPDAKIKLIDYKEIGLEDFENKVLKVMKAIQKTDKDGEKLAILHKNEQELLPQLRGILESNLDKILKSLDGLPLENVIVVGYSLGGLISSVLIELLGNSDKGQAQAMLTSMAPPVGFVNCALQIANDCDSLTTKTVFPWIMHAEIGEKDPIWPRGVLKMQQCFSVFMNLDDESLKHFSNGSHDGHHIQSANFDDLIKKAALIAQARQKGDINAAVTVLN
jgi:hypothetical protein